MKNAPDDAAETVRSTDWLDRFERLSNSMLKWPRVIFAFCMGMTFAVVLMVICYIWTGGK